MEKKNIYSLFIMCIMVIGIVLTYNSWELCKGSLVLWSLLLTAQIFILVGYFVDWAINQINHGK